MLRQGATAAGWQSPDDRVPATTDVAGRGARLIRARWRTAVCHPGLRSALALAEQGRHVDDPDRTPPKAPKQGLRIGACGQAAPWLWLQ